MRKLGSSNGTIHFMAGSVGSITIWLQINTKGMEWSGADISMSWVGNWESEVFGRSKRIRSGRIGDHASVFFREKVLRYLYTHIGSAILFCLQSELLQKSRPMIYMQTEIRLIMLVYTNRFF